MSEKLGEALLDINTNDRGFSQGVDRAGRKATGLGRTFDETSRRAMQLGKVMAAVGVAAFTAGIAGAVKRLEDMRKMSAQVDQALKNSNNSAHTSAKEIEAWADKLEDRTGRAAEEVMAVSANLASFGFGHDVFYRAIALADDMSAAWGGDLRQNLEGLSRALDDPIGGMAMLSKRGVKLTEDQKALAQSFIDAGDKASAQGVVFDALEGQVKGVAEAGFGGLTAVLARGRKVWEDAFEDMVTGEGDAGDLRDTLEDLITTLSSPQFVAAVTGFGSAVAKVITFIANVASNAYQVLGDVAERFKSFDQQSVAGLEQRMRDIGLRRTELGNQILQQQGMLDRGDTGPFGVNTSNLQDAITAAKAEIAKLNDQEQQVMALLDQRKPIVWPPVDSGGGGGGGGGDGGGGGGGGGSSSDKAGSKVEDYIAKLKAEREALDLDATSQAVLNAQRQAGADATPAQLAEIASVVTETEEHRAALDRLTQTYETLGEAGGTALHELIDAMQDGKVEGKELLGILGDVLSMAGRFALNQAAQSAGAGTLIGSLLSGFAGAFADGGLIPSGGYGIVGEAGPELVTATSHGAHVTSNASLADMLGGGGRGPLNLYISGVGLTEAEVSRAVGDALDRYDRYTLPGRVGQINANPLAKG